jgi:hypothetical protein
MSKPKQPAPPAPSKRGPLHEGQGGSVVVPRPDGAGSVVTTVHKGQGGGPAKGPLLSPNVTPTQGPAAAPATPAASSNGGTKS